MSRRDTVLLAMAASMIVAAVVFAAHPPAPRYYPLEDAWRWRKEAGVPSMGWYGLSAWMLLAGALAGGIVYVLGRRFTAPPPEQANLLLAWTAAGLTLAAFLAGAMYAVLHEWHRLQTLL